MCIKSDDRFIFLSRIGVSFHAVRFLLGLKGCGSFSRRLLGKEGAFLSPLAVRSQC